MPRARERLPAAVKEETGIFYYVEGTVAHLERNLAVIDCGGVGYACHTSQNTISALKEGKRARLYTHLYVREGLFDLYGFGERRSSGAFCS